MLTEVLGLVTSVRWVKRLTINKTEHNLCLLWKAFTAHFVSEVTPIHFINGNEDYVGSICNSMVCCSIWINSACNAGMKSVICS